MENLEVRRLFAGYESIQGTAERRDYIKDELVSMAEDGSLSATEVMYQRTIALIDTAGDVIRGMGYRDGAPSDSEEIPQELEEYRIKLRPINGKTSIRFKRGFYRVAQVRKGRAAGGDSVKPKYFELEPGPDGTVTMPLKQAWSALRQHGRWVSGGNPRRAARQLAEWWYEEVHHSLGNAPEPETQTDAPPAKRPYNKRK